MILLITLFHVCVGVFYMLFYLWGREVNKFDTSVLLMKQWNGLARI